MGEPFERDGVWWHEAEDGVWYRWDPLRFAWVPQPAGPDGPPASAPLPPPPPSGDFIPLDRRAGWAIGFLSASVVFALVAALSGVLEWSLLGRLARGAFVATSEIETNDARQGLVAVIQLGLLIATAVAFIRWFHRAYANSNALGATQRKFGSGWAIGGWFVPILNLIRPKQIADDIWRVSNPEAARSTGRAPVPGFVHAWWACWIGSGLLGYAAAVGIEGATTPADAQPLAAVLVASDVLAAIAGILAVRLVREVTARQSIRRSRIGGLPPEHPRSVGST